MNKEEGLWVVVRAVGLVFLVLAIVSLAKLISVGFYWAYIGEIAQAYDSVGPLSDGQKFAHMSVKSMFSNNAGEFILYGVSAFYFMCRGKFVHRAISK